MAQTAAQKAAAKAKREEKKIADAEAKAKLKLEATPMGQAQEKVETANEGVAKAMSAVDGVAQETGSVTVRALKSHECEMYGKRYKFAKGDIFDISVDAYNRFTHEQLPGPIVVAHYGKR